ncbi:MAG: hypothetical protein LUD02_01585 [Tannerellaceae bacterium]|nr:hypothetical protein [Tannerellaceae bacterium]MCD8262990.1 hypothetical protein [Tannerellaceae bacterium]
MAKYILGITNIKCGTPEADGKISQNLKDMGAPITESVTFEDEEGEVVKHFKEGERYPFLTLYSAAGTTFKFAVEMTNENLKYWLGGEVVDGQWRSPRGDYHKVQSLELLTEFGLPVRIPKATCYGVRKFGQKSTDLSKIEVTAIVELLADASEAPMVIGTKEIEQQP